VRWGNKKDLAYLCPSAYSTGKKRGGAAQDSQL
jgi:hypothetical protein